MKKIISLIVIIALIAMLLSVNVFAADMPVWSKYMMQNFEEKTENGETYYSFSGLAQTYNSPGLDVGPLIKEATDIQSIELNISFDARIKYIGEPVNVTFDAIFRGGGLADVLKDKETMKDVWAENYKGSFFKYVSGNIMAYGFKDARITLNEEWKTITYKFNLTNEDLGIGLFENWYFCFQNYNPIDVIEAIEIKNTVVTVSDASDVPSALQYLDYEISNGEVTITDCDSSTNGALEIPSTIEGCPVTRIASYAFEDCISLSSITIPEGVISIGEWAFVGCDNLARITIPSSVTSIGDCAFINVDTLMRVDITDINAWCKINFADCYANPLVYAQNLYLDGTKVTEVVVPDGVTNIDYTFSYCNSLVSITIPDSVTSIGSGAFRYCSALKSITIPDSVTSIGAYAFDECSSLTSITIPDSVTSIGEYAFADCESLTSATIGNGVTGIFANTFNCCFDLISITLPADIEFISRDAFGGCHNLAKVNYKGTNEQWDNILIGENNERLLNANIIYNYDPSVTPTPQPQSALQYLTYEISNGEVTITGCDTSASGELEIPAQINGYPVTGIGGRAFYYCSGITSITIPNSVLSIASYAFYYCRSLINITIPDSVISIGGGAFDSTAYYNDTNNWDSGVLYIGKHLVEVNSTISGTYTIKDGTKTIAPSAFWRCTSLTSITIPDSVTSIGEGTFDGCSSLTSITIPNSVTSIGDCAFYGCSGLTSITIPESVTSIGSAVFEDCRSLTSITIPDSVTSIGSSAFQYCRSLTSIIIPDSVASIGSSAFAGCSSLNGIIIPDSVVSIGGSAFYSCSSLTSIIIPDSVASIGSRAFEDCSKLTSITIPDSVTSIGIYAFYNCSALTSITILDGVTTIAEYAFENCTGLTSITIPESVTNIGNYAFLNCSNLEEVTFLDSAASIGEFAFNGCGNLANVELGNNITSIGVYAFYNCDNLTSITIPDSVTSISTGTFKNCSKLSSITIPNTVEKIRPSAFSDCDGLQTVYYSGTEEQWNNISISTSNECLLNATIVYPSSKSVYGDLNGDGAINKKDDLTLRMHLASASVEIDLDAADVFYDGTINKKDQLLLKQYLAGWEVVLGR